MLLNCGEVTKYTNKVYQNCNSLDNRDEIAMLG